MLVYSKPSTIMGAISMFLWHSILAMWGSLCDKATVNQPVAAGQESCQSLEAQEEEEVTQSLTAVDLPLSDVQRTHGR